MNDDASVAREARASAGGEPAAPSRLLAASGAILIGASLLVGAVAGLAMTDKIDADGHTLLAAHVAGLMGAFMIFGLGWSLPMVNLSASAKTRLAWCVIVPNYANLTLTFVKGFLRVHALDFGPTGADSAIFVALNILVVLPALAAVGAWTWGLLKKA